MWFSKPKSVPEVEAPFFAWTREEHSVGVTVFDRDHERIAALMSQIHTTLQVKHDRDQAQRLMETLIRETQAHFDHEEGVMLNVDYADREVHAAEHAALIQQAKTMLQKVHSGGVSALALPNFLKTWLIAHIQTMDRKYSACMRRNGLH
jgi:hemerythrin-like metal-binding protein